MRALTAAVLIVLLPSLAMAVSIPVTGSDLTGSRSTPFVDGIYANGGVPGNLGWSAGNGGFMISWDISYNAADQDWDYSYSITNASGDDLQKALSHWILQISADIPGDKPLSDFIYDVEGGSLEGPATYTATSNGNSDPDMPASIYGIKFDGTEISFSSTQRPVWGDFYAKDGTDKPTGPGGNAYRIDVTAWNTGLDPANGFVLSDLTTDFTPWIPTPDTLTGPPNNVPPGIIPEPATLTLVGLGVAGLAARKVRRAKK